MDNTFFFLQLMVLWVSFLGYLWDICVQVFVWTYIFSFLKYIPRSRITGSYGNSNFWGTARLFSTMAALFQISTGNVWGLHRFNFKGHLLASHPVVILEAYIVVVLSNLNMPVLIYFRPSWTCNINFLCYGNFYICKISAFEPHPTHKKNHNVGHET